jgi:hypothetical protein
VPYYLEISISGNEPAGSLIDVDYLALLEMEFYRTHFFDEWVFTFQDRSAILPYIYCDTVYDITNVSIHIWDSETPWNEIQCDFLVNGEPPEILQISSCNNYPISITAKR